MQFRNSTIISLNTYELALFRHRCFCAVQTPRLIHLRYVVKSQHTSTCWQKSTRSILPGICSLFMVYIRKFQNFRHSISENNHLMVWAILLGGWVQDIYQSSGSTLRILNSVDVQFIVSINLHQSPSNTFDRSAPTDHNMLHWHQIKKSTNYAKPSNVHAKYLWDAFGHIFGKKTCVFLDLKTVL